MADVALRDVRTTLSYAPAEPPPPLLSTSSPREPSVYPRRRQQKQQQEQSPASGPILAMMPDAGAVRNITTAANGVESAQGGTPAAAAPMGSAPGQGSLAPSGRVSSPLPSPLAALVHSSFPFVTPSMMPKLPEVSDYAVHDPPPAHLQEQHPQQLQQRLQQHVCQQLLQLPVVDWVLQPLARHSAVAAAAAAATTATTTAPPGKNEQVNDPVTLAGIRVHMDELAEEDGGGGGREHRTSTAEVPRCRSHTLASTRVTATSDAVQTSGDRAGPHQHRRQRQTLLPQSYDGGGGGSAAADPAAPKNELYGTGEGRCSVGSGCLRVSYGVPPLASVTGAADAARVLLQRGSSGSSNSRLGGGRAGGDSSTAAAAILAAELEDSLPPVALGAVTIRNASLRVFILGKGKGKTHRFLRGQRGGWSSPSWTFFVLELVTFSSWLGFM